MRPEDEEPIDLTAIRRDDALIDAIGSGDVVAARAMADPDDPLVRLIDESAACAARIREILNPGPTELAAERRERAALAAKRRRLRALSVMAPLVVAVGVVAWRRLR